MIRKIFEKTSAENRAALAIFVSCGDPNLDFTEKLVERVCLSGADIIELGVPFSDPAAAGPAVQGASLRAIKSETSIDGILRMVGNLRAKGVSAPFVMFSYYNPIFKRGVENTVRDCVESGVSACAIFDVPLEESSEVLKHTQKFGLDLIALAYPTTSLKRLAEISDASSGFLHYTVFEKIAGDAARLSESIANRVDCVKEASNLPLVVGLEAPNFSVLHDVALHADAVDSGECIVDLAHKVYAEKGEKKALEEVGKLVASMAEQMKRLKS